MTLICSEGHSEHDELSCVRAFFGDKYPIPKAHRTCRRGLPIPTYHPFSKRSVQSKKSTKLIPRFTF